jgi:thymidylate synthase
MRSYLGLLSHILNTGKDRSDRTGVGTRGIFGYQWRHNMDDGFPLLTTKKVHFHSIVVELLWFLRGGTNIKFLNENNVSIWNEWADENGDLGPVYGKQWRKWESGDGAYVDQIAILMRGLQNNPFSRRHIVSAWNPSDVPQMKLPPCHTLWQCHVQDGRLNLQLYARSIDAFLGLPFNIASYALLLKLLGFFTGLTPGELIICFGDLHIYQNHMKQVELQLSREPLALPRVNLNPMMEHLDDIQIVDIALVDYNHLPGIKAPIAV